jgi:FkbM family methyltransferase
MSSTTITVKNKNIIFEHPIKDHISMVFQYNNFYDINMLSQISNLKLSGTYIDIGAHIGNHSLFFAIFCNSTKVISCEGNPINYSYLNKNILNNNLTDKIIPYNFIIDSNNNLVKNIGYSSLYSNNTGCSIVIDDNTNTNYSNIQSVKTMTIDSLTLNEDNIVLIKLDIEGYEYQALLGSEDTIKKYHPYIIIELHSEYYNGQKNVDCATNKYEKEIWEFLKKYNYKVIYNASCDYIFY